MDFFDQQERARKSSGRLVLLFALAVAGMIAVVYLAVLAAFAAEGGLALAETGIWVPEIFAAVALGVVGVVGAGSAWKTAQLRGGGEVVAKRMGGRRLDPGTRDWKERRLLNVVEEMAIASGTPVPAVFLMEDEEGINAFAAGHAEGDAVVGITRGAMEKLSREELQGVVAHEFSHILNGDMRLNLRLMGILHGILLLGIIGRVMLHGGGGRRRRSGKGGGGGGIVFIGLALFLVGYIGTFFGGLIKAAVSRQREYLADASAVQFTRDPSGIGGALRKIGGLDRGSRLEAAYASEASHMLFGQGLKRLSGLLSTHPPLAERIRRIDPGFEGRFEPVPPDYVAPPEPELAGLAAAGGGGAAGAVAGFAGAGASAGEAPAGPGSVRTGPSDAGGAADAGGSDGPPVGGVLERIGSPSPEHVAYARRLMAQVPEPLREAAHDPVGAPARLHSLLPGRDPGGAARSRALEGPGGAAIAEAARRLASAVEALPAEARLPLVEAAAGTLTALPRAEAERFVRALRALASGEDGLALEEWLLVRLVVRHLEQHLEPARSRSRGYRSLRPFAAECSVLLSALAHAGHAEGAGARDAFAAAADALEAPGLELRSAGEAREPRLLEAALETLSGLVPPMKKRLVRACATSVAADRTVTPREAELFRVVADSLGVPVPPLLPGQRLD
ncbi:MAG: M48 family metallopeptidase [Gemmatimonadetes bacterium]|nr:M48 family metallopeptidase [Gemmatimonadota bacterium]